jgi:hypothetical protein
MDTLKRQKAKRPRDGGNASPAQIAEHVLRNVNSPHIVIGPTTWQPSDGTAGKRWYVTIAASEAGRGFRCDQVILSPDSPEEDRAGIMAAFVARRPIVIHDVDDELYMARLCETLWPGPEITKLRQAVEAERAASCPQNRPAPLPQTEWRSSGAKMFAPLH